MVLEVLLGSWFCLLALCCRRGRSTDDFHEIPSQRLFPGQTRLLMPLYQVYFGLEHLAR
jgi:hypothetical protein